MACGRVEGIVPDESDFIIRFYTGIDYTTKSKDPEETYIHDINLFIFDDKGNLEDARFIDSDKLTMTDKGAETSFRWIKDKSCMAYACANFGYKITGIENLGDLMSYRYHMAYPDEYSRGIPMSGKAKKDKASKSLTIPLTRMMAKISMNIDRTALAAGVQYSVRSVRIGGSPKSALAFGQSKATGNTDIFSGGFSKSFTETYNLNIDKKPGISEEISLYMLENMQGDLLPKAKDEKDKILESSDALSEVCSYIEIKAEYRSESMYSRPDEYLVYRFYLGDRPKNFDIERNCNYHLTVKPEKDGIVENSWRVDKTGLAYYGDAHITIFPGNYIEGHVGEKVHIWAEVTPKGCRLEFGKEELEFDKSRGIYDYKMDKDGHGVTLELKSRGSGIVYVEAGTPTSDAAMVYIEVN